MRALIAEDEQTARKLMQAYLRNIATCDVAANGREAVHKFRLALENRQPYDLICMDIGMPDMNGRESMKVIRQNRSRTRYRNGTRCQNHHDHRLQR